MLLLDSPLPFQHGVSQTYVSGRYLILFFDSIVTLLTFIEIALYFFLLVINSNSDLCTTSCRSFSVNHLLAARSNNSPYFEMNRRYCSDVVGDCQQRDDIMRHGKCLKTVDNGTNSSLVIPFVPKEAKKANTLKTVLDYFSRFKLEIFNKVFFQKKKKKCIIILFFISL